MRQLQGASVATPTAGAKASPNQGITALLQLLSCVFLLERGFLNGDCRQKVFPRVGRDEGVVIGGVDLAVDGVDGLHNTVLL